MLLECSVSSSGTSCAVDGKVQDRSRRRGGAANANKRDANALVAQCLQLLQQAVGQRRSAQLQCQCFIGKIMGAQQAADAVADTKLCMRHHRGAGSSSFRGAWFARAAKLGAGPRNCHSVNE